MVGANKSTNHSLNLLGPISPSFIDCWYIQHSYQNYGKIAV